MALSLTGISTLAAPKKNKNKDFEILDDLQRKRIKIPYSHTGPGSSTGSISSISNSVFSHSDYELSGHSDIEEHAYSIQKQRRFSKKKHSEYTGLSFRDEVPINHKPKCNSKNAVMARYNRLKKKKYIESLETKNAQLIDENRMLKEVMTLKVNKINALKRKTSNLYNVIRNHTEIGSLLKCLHLNTNLQISSSLLNDLSTESQEDPLDSQLIDSLINMNSPETTVKEEGNAVDSDFYSPNSVVTMMSDISSFNESSLGLDFTEPLLNESDVLNNLSGCCPFQLSDLQNIATESIANFIESDDNRCETPSKGYDEFCSKDNIFCDIERPTGICLHVANKTVSLEFCDTCNINAFSV